MSCQIKLTATIQDIAAIRRCLFPTDDQRGSDSWLQLCEISVSPTGDIIAIANERRMVVLGAKWDSAKSLSIFQILFSGSIHDYDRIKAVLCLPIVGQSQSSHIGADWTCIMLGYDSGYVRFYTESAELLLEEQLQCENITSIKCESQHSPRPDISPGLHPEEVYVQYQSNICVLSGSQLFLNLRMCRSQLARAQAMGDSLDFPQVQLIPKKWGFTEQSVINDNVIVGLDLASTFDHLLTASTCGGFDTKYRAMPPHNNLVLAAGSKPFVGYHYALEGGAQPVLSDVAKAMATKLKSALPGWLTGQKSVPEKQITVSQRPADSMGCRFGLCDLRRTAISIILSQDRKLAAVSDNLGRVLLVDAFKGITLKIFKGCRDAQCSFIQVPEEKKSKHKRGDKVALFLVIYSPKKGTVEIFSVQQGMKVTTFTASKFSRLMYITYGLMGFTTTSKSKYICQFTTIFIDNDGQIKEIHIPFHFALPETNNKRARDIHLYKKLKQLIKTGEVERDTLVIDAHKICTELKTEEIQLQTIEMLLHNKDVPAEVTLQCTEHFCTNEDETESELNSFRTLCANANAVVKFYLFLDSLTSENLDEENGNSGECNSNFNSSLNLGAKDLKNLQKLLDLSTLNDNMRINDLKVSFSDSKSVSVLDFICVFELSHQGSIHLKPNLDESLLFKASEILFKKYITNSTEDYDELKQQILCSRIDIKDLFILLMNYWVNRSLYNNLNLEQEMNNLSCLLYTLVQTSNDEDIVVDYNSISTFWASIRNILANCSRAFPALTAAILCKYVAHKIEIENELKQSGTSLEDESIEMLSQENCEWALLIGKLEDVSLLNLILSNKPIASDCPLPKLYIEKKEITLKYILQNGRGSVSKLVARWLASGGINPESIIINEIAYKKSSPKNKNAEQNQSNKSVKIISTEDLTNEIPVDKLDSTKCEPVFQHLNIIKPQFPYSLEAGSLLANMSWEYALAWKKDIQDLGNLEACIKCLQEITSIHIKLGLYILLWNIHFKIICESTCKLINKVGKVPKERLCRQDTGLTDYQICLFINICTNFIDSFMDVVPESYKVPKPVLHFEPIWENGSQPLIELAVQHREINYDLLHIQYELSLVFQMIITFSIKHTKPINNLFESTIVNLLFSDLQNNVEVTFNKTDPKLNNSRTQFIVKVISASLESVTVNDSKIHCSEHVTWMSKCLNLARIWNLDVDLLKRYQVVQLFVNGFDILAEDLLPAINEKDKIGPELLAVAATRLSQYLASSPDFSDNISALSPNLTRYLDTLKNEWCAPSSLNSITNLATHAHVCIKENQPEHKLVELLLDACSNLQEIQT